MRNSLIRIANELQRLIIKAVKALWWLTIKIVRALWWLLVRVATIIYDNFNKRHRNRLGKGENMLRLIISIFILYIFSKTLLETDWKLGVSFIIAGLTAIWFGYIYRGRDVMGLVLVGVIIGTLVTALAPDAWKALSGGDFIGAVVIGSLMIYLYFKSRELKRGRRPKW